MSSVRSKVFTFGPGQGVRSTGYEPVTLSTVYMSKKVTGRWR